jgi:hypothetical protein
MFWKIKPSTVIRYLSKSTCIIPKELSDNTPSNTTLGIYVSSLRYNGQHVLTRYRVIIRPIGAYILVHDRNMYILGSHSVYIPVYWPSINFYKLWANGKVLQITNKHIDDQKVLVYEKQRHRHIHQTFSTEIRWVSTWVYVYAFTMEYLTFMIILYFCISILIFTVSIIDCILLIIYTNLYLANIHRCKLNGIPWCTCSFHVLILKLQLAWWWPYNGSKHVAHCTSVNKHIFQVLCSMEYSHLVHTHTTGWLHLLIIPKE